MTLPLFDNLETFIFPFRLKLMDYGVLDLLGQTMQGLLKPIQNIHLQHSRSKECKIFDFN